MTDSLACTAVGASGRRRGGRGCPAQKMKRKLTVLLLVLAALLALVCCALAENDPIKVTIEFPDNPKSAFMGAGDARVTITVKNISDRALPGPVTLYNPSGKLEESFGSPVLEVGASTAWEGVWTISDAMLDEGKLTFALHYSVYLENGSVDAKSVAFKKTIRRVAAEPSVEVTRTITPTMAAEGQKVTVTYEIANTGEVPVENVTITEHASMNLQPVSIGTIEPGAKGSYDFTVIMTKSDLISAATVAYTGNGVPYNQQSEPAAIRYGEVNLTASVSADRKGGVIGTQATLTVTLNNKGKTDYEHVTISDPVKGDLFSDLTVKAGEKLTQTLTVDIDETRNYQFYVSAEGTEVVIDVVDRDSVREFPGIVYFTVKITNNSAAELTDVVLTTSGADFSKRLTVIPSILPGETRTYTRDLNVSMPGTYQFQARASDQIGESHEFKSNTVFIEQAVAEPSPTSRARKAAAHRAALDHLQVRSIRDYESESDSEDAEEDDEEDVHNPPEHDPDFEQAVEAAARRRRGRIEEKPRAEGEEPAWNPQRLRDDNAEKKTDE